MASDTHMLSSVDGSSDIIYDFSCKPCFEDGKNTEAVTFCVNCQTYFCKTCVGLHNKLLKSHTVLDQAAMTTGHHLKPKTKEISTDECVDHPGNAIQMYCGQHDIVCCTVCIAVDHRGCKDVDYIPKVAKGFLKGQVKTETKTSLDLIYKELQELKSDKSNEILELTNAQDDILKDIKKLKDRILARIDELEKNAITDVNAKYIEISEHIEAEIKHIEELLKATADQILTIDKANSKNEAQLFISIKNSLQVKAKGEQLIAELKEINSRRLSFELDSQFEDFLNDFESFGSVSGTSNHPYTASLIGEYNCKVSAEKNCLIFDSCVLENGHVLVTDYNNDKLKRLDKELKQIDSCGVQKPFGVCKTGSNIVAVTSWDGKKFCLVTVGDTMTVNKTISVGETCKGIVHQNGELFIACGTSVKVYDISGALIRTLPYKFSSATHLCMDRDGSEIFVADKYHGLVKLSAEGECISKFSDTLMQQIFDVSADTSTRDGSLFVCCKDSDNVVQLDKDGNVIKEILTKADMIESPVSITFARAPKRLLLTFWPSDSIKVFLLK